MSESLGGQDDQSVPQERSAYHEIVGIEPSISQKQQWRTERQIKNVKKTRAILDAQKAQATLPEPSRRNSDESWLTVGGLRRQQAQVPVLVQPEVTTSPLEVDIKAQNDVEALTYESLSPPSPQPSD